MSDFRKKGTAASRETPERNRLRAEIEFWEMLIDSAEQAGDSQESIERMEHALALAAYRILRLDDPSADDGPGRALGPGPHCH